MKRVLTGVGGFALGFILAAGASYQTHVDFAAREDTKHEAVVESLKAQHTVEIEALERQIRDAEAQAAEVATTLDAQREVSKDRALRISRLASEVELLKNREPEVIVETETETVEVERIVEVPALVEHFEDGSVMVNGEGFCIAGQLCDDEGN